jgi:predicted nucleic acid-binding protein
MRLIDSYGWIEYFTDGPLAKKYAPYIETADASNTLTPTIVVYEVYKALKQKRGEQVALEAYAQITATDVVPLNGNLALGAADASLATGLAMADAIIYSTAKAYSAELVTSDKHLKPLEGVKFIG